MFTLAHTRRSPLLVTRWDDAPEALRALFPGDENKEYQWVVWGPARLEWVNWMDVDPRFADDYGYHRFENGDWVACGYRVVR